MAKKKNKMSILGGGVHGGKATVKPYPSVKPQPTTPTPWKKSVVKNTGDKAK